MKLRTKILLFMLPPLLVSGLLIYYLSGRVVCSTLHSAAAEAAASATARFMENHGSKFVTREEKELLPTLYALMRTVNAAQVGGNIALIDRGQLLQLAPPRTLVTRPANRAAAELV
ncbi:MAG: hypothetical protein RQ748_07860, partial [Elusimicrobiales bacterium]|nr:hypothetical protein [Elusimicrobiales bacterium]